jgi:biotin operon repressor
MNCDNLRLDEDLHKQRIAQAQGILGAEVVSKILGYGLFLLGALRSDIASFIDMPPGSVRSLIRAMHQRGLPALEDQRSKTSSFKPPAPVTETVTLASSPALSQVGSSWRIELGLSNLNIDIPDSNPLQKRIVLLTLLANGLLSRHEVAQALGLSEDRTAKLARLLQERDVQSVMDQRHGQQQDYRFTPEIKSELIQQFVLDVVDQGKASGEQLAANLKRRCNIVLSPRTILHHVSSLGLKRISRSLPDQLSELQKKRSKS